MDKRIFQYEGMYRDYKQLLKMPKKTYSDKEKQQILDYLYNIDFSLFDEMAQNKEKDVFDNELFDVYSGMSMAGEYSWTSIEPLYVLKHNIALSEGIMNQINDFYNAGKQVQDTTWDWKKYTNTLSSEKEETTASQKHSDKTPN